MSSPQFPAQTLFVTCCIGLEISSVLWLILHLISIEQSRIDTSDSDTAAHLMISRSVQADYQFEFKVWANLSLWMRVALRFGMSLMLRFLRAWKTVLRFKSGTLRILRAAECWDASNLKCILSFFFGHTLEGFCALLELLQSYKRINTLPNNASSTSKHTVTKHEHKK